MVVADQPLVTHRYDHIARRQPRRSERAALATLAEPQRTLVRALEDQPARAARQCHLRGVQVARAHAVRVLRLLLRLLLLLLLLLLRRRRLLLPRCCYRCYR